MHLPVAFGTLQSIYFICFIYIAQWHSESLCLAWLRRN